MVKRPCLVEDSEIRRTINEGLNAPDLVSCISHKNCEININAVFRFRFRWLPLRLRRVFPVITVTWLYGSRLFSVSLSLSLLMFIIITSIIIVLLLLARECFFFCYAYLNQNDFALSSYNKWRTVGRVCKERFFTVPLLCILDGPHNNWHKVHFLLFPRLQFFVCIHADD